MAKRNRKGLKKLYDLHAWVGFQLALVMFVILFTGTVATVAYEIDWIVWDEVRATTPAAEREPLTPALWANMYASLREQYPERPVLNIFSLNEDYFAKRANIYYAENKQTRFAHVDPWSAEYTGEISRLTVQRIFRDLHRYMFMPAMPGLVIVCSFAFILAISLYTGLKTTRNWKTAITRVRVNQGPRILLSDLHKFAGLWGIWFLVVITITSFWYLYEFGFGVAGKRLVHNTAYTIEVEERQPIEQMSVAQFERVMTMADEAMDWNITMVTIPAYNNQLVMVRGTGANPLLRDRAHTVWINHHTMEMVDKATPESIDMHAYLNEYADPLHFGYFGGIWTKLIWFVFGIALTGMSVTGVLMTWKRIKSSEMTRAQWWNVPVLMLPVIMFFFYYPRFL